MAEPTIEYKRLPGRGLRRQGFTSVTFSARRARLWLAPDHLLAIESQWYTEDYRRFYFRDIQSIVLRRTTNGRTINLVLLLPLFLALWAAFVTTDGWQIFWLIVAAGFALGILGNTLLGPTSVCELRTAVQTEELPSLQRLCRARKVLARIRPLIAAAQGSLAPESSPAAMDTGLGSSSGPEPASGTTTPATSTSE